MSIELRKRSFLKPLTVEINILECFYAIATYYMKKIIQFKINIIMTDYV